MQHAKHKRSSACWPLVVLAIAITSIALAGPAGAEHRTWPRLTDSGTGPRSTDSGTGPRSTDSGTGPASGAGYLPGQVVVKYKGADGLSRLLAATAGWQTQLVARIPKLGIALLQVPAGAETSVAAQLQRDRLVEYVELNYRARALEEPNDPEWPQWALLQIGAPQAWDITHCQGTIVAVLDTGVDLGHPDLHNALWTNADEIPDNGMDDDGNGKVDDVHGWHFFQDCSTGTCQPRENHVIEDDNGHGTHVAGIAAAETDNGIGVAGVSWGARAMIVKVLDNEGDGYYYDIAEGIRYAADNGAQVINLSLGGDVFSQLLQDAVNYAHQREVLLVAASGNNGENDVLYPAACENVMAVAATDGDDRWASFSNYGPEVDIAAPGTHIASTWPGGYHHKQGTSMAAAHVSGAAALLWSWRPDFTNAQIESRLKTRADDVNADANPGRDAYLGWGRLNVYRALADLPRRYVYHLMPIFKRFGASR